MAPRWIAAAVLVLTGCGIAVAQSVDTRHLHTPSQIRIVGPSLVGREDATKGGAETITLGENLTLVDGVLSATGGGDPGEPGQGVPVGGTDGQVLTKQSGTDYHTDWETPAADAVTSVHGRTGTIIGESGDYTVDEVTGAVPDSRTITAGVGLSGGGTLSADRTIDLENTSVTPGTYTNTTLTVGSDGRLQAASSGSISTSLGVLHNGSLVGTRPSINMIAGSNVTLSVNDDAGNNRVNITVSSSGSGSGSLGRTFIPCTGNITSALLTAFNANEPVSLGPGACTVTAPFAPSVTVIDWRGSNMARTDVTFTAPAAGRCGFERLPADADGLSQSYISDMTFIMTGTARDTFCIAGLSNGTVFRNVDFRSGKTQMRVTPATSDNSVCFRCEFDNIFGGFGNSDSMFIFDGTDSSFLLMTMNMLDIHNNSGNGATLPLIEIAGMSDELSHVVITGALFDTGGATAGLPVIDVIDAAGIPIVINGAHMANGSTAIDFVRANSNIALTSFGFNAMKDPSGPGPFLVCGSFVNYVSPATATDVSCNTQPGMTATSEFFGRPVVVNGRSLTVP